MEYILKQSRRDSHHSNMADMESPSGAQPSCAWAQASGNFAIHIPAEVIGSLATESLVALKRVPRRGLETGGILLGRTEFRDDTTTFWIEGFVPIESEHRFGPSYVLSDSDVAHLQSELTSNGTASLGIYRSQTRSEQLAIDDPDVGLFEKCFGAGDNLFLMLAPVLRTGAFYFRDDGNLKCVHQFTLVSSLSPATASSTTASSVTAQGRALPSLPSAETQRVHASIAGYAADRAGALVVASQRSDQNVPPGERQSPGLRRLWMTGTRERASKLWIDSSGRVSGMKFRNWLLAAFAVAVLTVNLLSYSFRHSVPPDHRASDHRAPNFLYLTVERAGPALRLLWDGNSSAVRGATRAILHIQDGDQAIDRELAHSELMAGQFTYQPQHSAVTFQLNAYAGEPNAIGLVQVMFPPSPVTAPPPIQPIPQPIKSSPPPAPPPAKPMPLAEPLTVRAAPAPPSNDRKYQEVEPQLTLVRSSGASEIGPAVREPSLPKGLEDSRQRSPIVERNDVSTSGPQLTVRTSTTPVPGSRLGRVFGKIPLVGRLRKPSKAVEAVPVHQAQPIVRMPNDQQLLRPVSVGVKVYVSDSGAVNEAEVVDYGDPLNLTLANAALAAARNWTFEPSRVDDVPIGSQVIIHFYFSP